VSIEIQVTIIIPFKDKPILLETCLKSILETPDINKTEIILVDNQSQKSKTFKTIKYFTDNYHFIKVYKYNHSFNYSKINNFAATISSGQHLLFLNNDTEVINKFWIRELLKYSKKNNIGAVGAKLLFSNNSIQHIGISFLKGQKPQHLLKHYDVNSDFPELLDTSREVAAVTGASLMIKKKVFEQIGGFNEENFPILYNDVDLCFRLSKKGYKNIICHKCLMFHHESQTRGPSKTRLKKVKVDEAFNQLKLKHPDKFDTDDLHLKPQFKYLLAEGAIGSQIALENSIKWLKNKVIQNQSLKIGLYGAGQYSERLLKSDYPFKRSTIYIFDDFSKKKFISKIPVIKVCLDKIKLLDLIIVASDTQEDAIIRKLKNLKLSNLSIYCLHSKIVFSL